MLPVRAIRLAVFVFSLAAAAAYASWVRESASFSRLVDYGGLPASVRETINQHIPETGVSSIRLHVHEGRLVFTVYIPENGSIRFIRVSHDGDFLGGAGSLDPVAAVRLIELHGPEAFRNGPGNAPENEIATMSKTRPDESE